MIILSVVLLYWNMQSLRIYDIQRNTITYRVIIGFWGWPKLLCYAISVDNIRWYLIRKPSLMIGYYVHIVKINSIFSHF